jgi:Ca-activated chloride channel family protein
MPQPSKFRLILVVLGLSAALSAQNAGQGPTPTQTTQASAQVQERDPVASPDDVSPGIIATQKPLQQGAEETAKNVPSGPDVKQPQGSDTVSIENQHPTKSGSDQYTFRANVDEVRLYATVVDQKQKLVTDLSKNDFRVYEDGQPQQITHFTREDVPVALGILIDNSGSMRDKREKVNDAALNLVRASNPQDQVFIVNFNDDAYLDQQFTPDVAQLREGLQHIDSRGGTALYDAVTAAAKYMIESSDFLKKKRIIKKVLLVVTDGEDNASRQSLEEAIKFVQSENGPTIYTIGLLGDSHARRAERALREMALDTGGVAFFPRGLDEVDAISSAVAKDIRNQYVILYRSTKPQSAGGYRQVKVEAQAPGYKNLQVRTRSGYYAGQEGQQQAQVQNAAPSQSQRR